MNTNTPIFADRIVNLAVTGNLVRLEFGSLQLQVEDGRPPQMESVQTIVLPIDGFATSFGMLERLVGRMIDAGVLARNNANVAAQSDRTADAPALQGAETAAVERNARPRSRAKK